MTVKQIENLFIGSFIEINDKLYHFHKNGRLEITGNGTEPEWGEYKFRLKDNLAYLSSKPQILEGKEEFPVEIFLDKRISLTLHK